MSTSGGSADEVAELRARVAAQDALLRVAALVARAASPAKVFDAVTTEGARLLDDRPVILARFEGSDEFVVVSSCGGPARMGERHPVEPGTAPERVPRYAAVVRADGHIDRDTATQAHGLTAFAAVAAPVEVAGAVWGVLIATSSAGPVPSGAERLLESFCELVATAINNGAARDRMEAVAEEQAALRRVAELAARGASAADVLRAVAVEGSRLSGVDFATLMHYESDGSTVIVAVHGAPSGVVVGMRASGSGDGAVQRLWRTGHAARVDDLTGVPGRWPGIAQEAGFAASVAVPIRIEGALWGTLVVVGRHRPLPSIEHHLANYAELVSMTIAAADARRQLGSLADEQAALRRVAELVARGTAPEDVFVAVGAEVSALLGDLPVELLRFDDETAVVVAAHNSRVLVGLRIPASPDTPTGRVLQTGQPVRADFAGTPLADLARQVGITAGVAVPVMVEGRVRAALTASTSGPTLPADTEARLTQFAELAAVAIANAETNAQLTASRARVVATSDEARRRLQRDVHDGAQQRLVHALIALKMALGAAETGCAASGLIEEALTHLERAGSDLRDIVHGILPRSLTHGGLQLGLESLVDDLPVTAELVVDAPRLPAATETTAYFVVAEALTNTVKHAQALRVDVAVKLDGDALVVEVRDDGVGGADHGSGLTGLADRVAAAGGRMTLVSPVGSGTTLHVELPIGPGSPQAR